MSQGASFFSDGRSRQPYWLASCDMEGGGRFFLGLRNGEADEAGWPDVVPTTGGAKRPKGIGTMQLQPRPRPSWEIVGDPLRFSDDEADEIADHLVSGGTLRSVYRDRTYELRAWRLEPLVARSAKDREDTLTLELRCGRDPGGRHVFESPPGSPERLLEHVSCELVEYDGIVEHLRGTALRGTGGTVSRTSDAPAVHTPSSTGKPRSLGEILVYEMKGAMNSYELAVSEQDLAERLEEVVHRVTGTRLLGYIKPEGARNDTTASFVTPEDLEPVPMWWAKGVFTVPVYGTGEPIGTGVSPASTPTSASEASIEVDSETSTDTSATPSS